MSQTLRLLLLVVGFLPGVAFAALGQQQQNNILGKFFVSSVNGSVTCISDGRILDLKKGDTIMARGAVIETAEKANATILFSNGTGVYIDEKTHYEVDKFDQEFFAPNNNLRVEPSNSSTLVNLASGRVVISTPRLLSGTTMVYRTPHAAVGIRGEKVMIEASEKQTHVAMIAGNATVNVRDVEGNFVSIGKRLVTGQEAFVKRTISGTNEEEVVMSTETSPAADGSTAPASSAAPAVAATASVPAAAAPAPDENAQVVTADVEAIVVRVTGPAHAKLPTVKDELVLTEGAKLPKGTVITTDEATELHLQPFEGTIATLRPNTTVQIEKLSVTTAGSVVKKQTALLDLKAGTVVSTIDPAKRDINDYGVRTPKGIASAKGTSFAVSIENEGFTVAATADTVSFLTPAGETYSITAGNVTITPPGGEPAPPISLAAAVAANSNFAGVVQTALNAVTTVIQNNIGSLPSNSAADLLSKVANTAAAALPAQATEIATKAITAATWPSGSTSSNPAAAAAAVTSAVVAAVPNQAAQVATSAALVAPTQAVAVAAAAAQGAPAQAAQIASAVTQTFVQTTPQGGVTPASVQTATAIAAAVTTAAPNQAAPVAAAVMQALSQAAPQTPPLTNSQHASTIASAVTAAAPDQAVPVAATMMKTLTQTPTFSEASSQVVAQTAATLASAVTVVVPPQAQEVATAVMQLLIQNNPTATPAATAEAAGLIAAAVSQAAPGQTQSVTQGLATAANLPTSTIQSSAAQAFGQATQITQQNTQVAQNAASATQQATTATNTVAQNTPSSLPGSSGSSTPAAPASTSPSTSSPAPGLPVPPTAADVAATGTSQTNNSTSIIVTQFDPASVGQLTSDLEAAQAAQSSAQFTPETSSTGTTTVTPTPTVPDNLRPNETSSFSAFH